MKRLELPRRSGRAYNANMKADEDQILAGAELSTVNFEATETDAAVAQTLEQQESLEPEEALREAVIKRIERGRRSDELADAEPLAVTLSKQATIDEGVFNISAVAPGAKVLYSIDDAPYQLYASLFFTATSGQVVKAFACWPGRLSSELAVLNV